jgi:DNA-binding NarL/FixJ family response regulator
METKALRILLADDNRDVRSALGLLLETRSGAIIVGEATKMESLLEQAAVTHPDVVFLDGELPGKPESGRISALRSVAPETQIVVISARPESAALGFEADAFVYKIDPPEQILAVLKERNKK